ncbi:MAG TPA: immunoglobulin domain-containing protein, partial [Chitinispirillaceae bacterium]|nr:immunoglobulin domain-containing protein [Chitinispirillaceae bacterium]
MGYSGSKIRLVLIFLSFLYSAIYGTNVTVDADGGAAYPSLDSLLKYYQATGSVILPDTITFTGNDIDTFFMTEYLAEAEVPTGGVLFRGLNLNPDSFPVIIHNKQGTTHYNLLLMKVSFERIVFTGTVPFRSDASNYGITFRKCIFRGFNDTSCIIFGATGSAVNVFENCLFVNNTVSSGLIHLNTYNVGRKINFVNCTFDNNAKVFKRTDGPDSTVTFKNSVFSGNGTIFTSDTMKSKATYCLTSETSLSGYGTGCRSGDPQYVVAAARAKPSDWKVMMNAPADTLGHITGAPTDDIAGRVRRTATPVGAGCWRADVPSKPQITDQPDTVVVNEDSTVTFSVAVTGSGVSYGWYKTGAATKLSDSAKFIKTAAFSDSGAEYYCIFSNETF